MTDELLDALAVGVSGIDRAFRIHDHAVDPVELAGAKALLAPRRRELAVLQRQLVHALESVIVIKKLPNEENVRYVPGYVSTEPVTRYNPWRQTYEIWYREVHHPGYTETESTVRHEITMWVTRDTAILVWAGTGEVIDPSSAEAVKKEVVEMVVPELVKQKLIPPAS